MPRGRGEKGGRGEDGCLVGEVRKEGKGGGKRGGGKGR